MGPHQIGDMNVVAHAGAIGCRIVGAVQLHLGPQPDRSLGRDLDDVGRLSGRLTDPQLRVGTRDVEIAQDHMAQSMRVAGVAQHDLGHQLRGTVRRHRSQRRILRHRHFDYIEGLSWPPEQSDAAGSRHFRESS